MSTADESTGLSPVVPLGFLALVVLTMTWSSSISRIRTGPAVPVVAEPAQTAEKTGAIKKKNSGSKKSVPEPAVVASTPPANTGSGDMKRVIILVASWVLFFVYLASGHGFGEGSDGPFDPYKILKIQSSATKSEIKKVYRTLSMDFHPDRLAGKSSAERSAAESQFVQISKAYKTLTDEEAMNNWLKYGHPDGPRTTTISFGIPAWMTKEENAGLVLLVYLSVFGVAGYLLKEKVMDAFKDEPEAEPDSKKKLK